MERRIEEAGARLDPPAVLGEAPGAWLAAAMSVEAQDAPAPELELEAHQIERRRDGARAPASRPALDPVARGQAGPVGRAVPGHLLDDDTVVGGRQRGATWADCNDGRDDRYREHGRSIAGTSGPGPRGLRSDNTAACAR